MGSAAAAAAAAAFVRAVVTVPMEASSAARYVVTSSATPTARTYVEAVGLRCLVLVSDREPARRSEDGEASRPYALPLFAADEGSGYLMEIPLRPRAHQLTGRPRALSAFLAGDDDSGPEVEIALRARSYPLVPRPRAHFLKLSPTANESLTRYGPAIPRLKRFTGPLTTLTSRRLYHSGLVSSPRANSQRLIELPSSQLSARRNWCWTPWSPNRPKAPKAVPTPPTSAQVVEQAIKMLKDLELTKEDEDILKEFFLQKLCTSREDPQNNDVKMDLILHGQALGNKMLHILVANAEKKPKKWGSITIWGKKIDLTNWFAAFISIFF